MQHAFQSRLPNLCPGSLSSFYDRFQVLWLCILGLVLVRPSVLRSQSSVAAPSRLPLMSVRTFISELALVLPEQLLADIEIVVCMCTCPKMHP